MDLSKAAQDYGAFQHGPVSVTHPAYVFEATSAAADRLAAAVGGE
jgi:hypothetical protein